MNFLPDPSRLAAAFLGLICGAGLYLALVNRVLSHLRDGVLKSSFLTLALLVCVGGLAIFGYLAGFSTWSMVLAAVLGWMAAGELRYRRLHQRLRSNPPQSITGKGFSLLHPITSQDLQVIHYRIALPGWQGSRLRVAHLSDFHLNTGSQLDYFSDVVQQVNAGKPDLLFITGDFAADLQGIEMLPEVLQPFSSRLGNFAILGNHDYWTDRDRVTGAILQAGFVLLRGSQLHFLQDGVGQLALSGCAAPWSGENCQQQVPPAGMPLLVLSHTADHIYRLSRFGASVVFSGHYHAGQMQLPFFGPLIVPSVYGRLFHHGHYRVGRTHLFVSAGLGASHPPLRIYCPPDILFVDLLGSQDSPSAENASGNLSTSQANFSL